MEKDIQEERQVCLSCLHGNIPGLDLCEKCGAPIGKYTTFLPFERTLAEGVCYRSAVSNPRKPIILIGIWILFAPGLLAFLYALFVAKNILLHKWPFPYGAGVAELFFLYGLISVIILYRTTRNYIKLKNRTLPENAQPEIDS